MILEKLIHFISYIKQDCLYNCNIFSNKHLEIYPNRVYSFNKVLLANHIRTCVAEDIREGKDETIDELVKVLQKLMK